MKVNAEIKQWGNSFGIKISKEIAHKLRLVKGDCVNITNIKKIPPTDEGFGKFKGLGPYVRDRNDKF